MQVINVDLLQQQGDGDKSDEAADDEDKSEGKEMKPPYYQPPVTVHEEALGEWLSIHPNDAFFQRHPELKQFQEEIYRLKHNMPSPGSKSSSSSSSNSNTRSLQQGAPLIPVDLISAQFLEMDTSPNMQIINQDDQYLNVSFPDPSNIVLQYSSISNLLDPASALSSQMEYVPGGAILVLVGVTASGEVVRNRLMWTYTMGCGMEDYTILDGDMIGWAGFVSFVICRVFCLFVICLILLQCNDLTLAILIAAFVQCVFTGESNARTTRVLSSIRQSSTATNTGSNHEHTRPNKDATNAHDQATHRNASTYHQNSNDGHAINYATNEEAIF